MGYMQDEIQDAVGSKWAKRLGAVFSVLVIWLVVSTTLHIWPFSVGAKLAQKVVNADAIVYNYEWFYDQYYQIKATRGNLFLLEKGSVEYTGTVMVLNQMISEYNSNSSKITRNMWKPRDESLPHEIPLFTGEED